MKKLIYVSLLLICTSFIQVGVDHHRWSIKTHPKTKTGAQPMKLSDIIELADPPNVKMNDKRFEDKIIPAFGNKNDLKEGDLITVKGYLHLVAYETNDDEYHIQISGSETSGDNCLIVEVPDPKNVDDEILKEKYENVRTFIRAKLLKGKAPGTGGNIIGGKTFVYVTGQLFYDFSHTHNQVRGKKGMHSNSLWEIHPIVDMNFARP